MTTSSGSGSPPPTASRGAKAGRASSAAASSRSSTSAIGFVAVENRCPHQGGPLADGIVTGCAVVCPLHAWKVRLDTGEVERPAGMADCVRTYPTRVEGGVVLVELPLAVEAGDADQAA